MCVSRQIAKDILQIQATIGDMKKEQTAGRQFGQVELEGLAADQMERDGIRAERVEHEQAKRARRGLAQAKAGVPMTMSVRVAAH